MRPTHSQSGSGALVDIKLSNPRKLGQRRYTTGRAIRVLCAISAPIPESRNNDAEVFEVVAQLCARSGSGRGWLVALRTPETPRPWPWRGIKTGNLVAQLCSK